MKRNKLKIDYTNYKKICTVLYGWVYIFVGSFFTFTTLIVGLCVLSDDIGIAFVIWLFTLVGIALTIYYSIKCSHYVYVGADGFYFKEKKYDWADACITIYAYPFNRGWKYCAFLGYCYLSEDEIGNCEVNKKGVRLDLNKVRLTILLSHYNKRIQVRNCSRIDKYTITVIENHNKQISDLSLPSE